MSDAVDLLIQSEDDRVRDRRRRLNEYYRHHHAALGLKGEELGLDPDAGTCGLALSGGGIRSATFSLGFLQGLSSRGLVPRIDYLSTVSGGSYIGSFFCALFVPDKLRGNGSATPASQTRAFDCVKPLESDLGVEAIKRLRESGRYLSPSGTSDAFYGAAIVLRNWTALQLAIGMVALLLFGVLHYLDQWVRPITDRLWPGLAVPASVSRALLLFLVLTLSMVLATGSAYWCTRRDHIPRSRRDRILCNPVFWALVLVFLYTSSPWWATGLGGSTPGGLVPDAGFIAGFVALTAAAGVAFYVGTELRNGRLKPDDPAAAAVAPPADTGDDRDTQRLNALEDKVRNRLSRTMSVLLKWLLAFACLLAIVWAGYWVLFYVQSIVGDIRAQMRNASFTASDLLRLLPAAVPPLLSYIVNLLLKSAKSAGDARAKESWITKNIPVLLVVAGVVLVAIWLILWSGVSYYVFDDISSTKSIWALVALIAINGAIAVSYSFVNLSSLSTFYAARLRRAYIGASSQGRAFADASTESPQDAILMGNYHQALQERLGPIHLINVTIAETTSGGSNIVARDRKGMPMVLSPFGIVHQAERPGDFCVRSYGEGEQLPLANWVAISGAAVAAAIGSGTSLGTSILATMTNVRLGYWWKAAQQRDWKEKRSQNLFDTVQNYLWKELIGAFDGTRRARWYLTDGGHFDNTGIYALLQRHVSLIIACDNGADPLYRMADLVRLIGRARTDLDVGITFLDDAQIKAKFGDAPWPLDSIGGYNALTRPGSPGQPGGPIAVVAEIDYGRHVKPGLLVVVKPRLTFSEPPELLAYRWKPSGMEFPQQTTADQFFDEEQWEAYRQLGELAARRLFPTPSTPGSPFGAIGSLV